MHQLEVQHWLHNGRPHMALAMLRFVLDGTEHKEAKHVERV